jgi:hypothetical protein
LFELSRIRLVSVGPPGARYEDVLIDLSGAGQPVRYRQPTLFGNPPLRPSPASVLLLENGGGKSVLIKLIFSVMLPGRRQVVGTTNTRVLEKFVAADDVSHVILEWMHSETGKLLITGKVSEWRDRAVSADAGKLEDKWYSFRPQSAADLNSISLVKDGRKLTTAACLDQLQASCDAYASMEFFRTKVHDDWTAHLGTLGLDPELFRYQREMNAGEGDAADAFTFPTDRAFVEFLLKAVLPQDELGDVADAVQTHASTLAKRADLVLERDFLAELLGLLDPLAEAEEADAVAREAAALSEQKLYVFAAAISRRAETQRGFIAERESHAKELQDCIDIISREHAEAEDLKVTLERAAAEIRLADAIRELASAKEAEEECVAVSEAWGIVELLVRWGRCSEAVTAAQRVIGEREQAATPALNALNAAARALRRALMATASEADRSAETELGLAAETGLELAANEKRYREFLRVSAEARAQASARADRVEEILGAVRQARESGLLAPSITAAEAHASCGSALKQASSTLESASELQEQLDERWEQAQQAQAKTAAAVSIAEGISQTAAGHLARAVERTEQLAGLARLAELIDVDVVNLDSDAEVLVELLKQDRLAAERKQLTLAVETASDERARQALGGSARLLPPSSDAVRVQELLQSRGIDCWTGWDYIAGIPDPAKRQLIVRANQLVLGGVVLNDAGELDEARDVLDRTGTRLTSIVPVTATEMMDSDVLVTLASGDNSWAYFVVSPHRALFDPEAAEAELAALEQRHRHHIALLDEISAKRDGDLELTAQIRQWRSDFPPGELERLASADKEARDKLAVAKDAAGKGEISLAALQAERQGNRDRLPALSSELGALGDRHRVLGDLARGERALAGLERERAEAEAAADAQDKLGEAAQAIMETLGETQQWHRIAANSHSASAQRARSELSQIPAVAEISEDKPVPADPVQTLRDRFDQADKAYKRVQVGEDLRDVLTAAQARLSAVEEEMTRSSIDTQRRAERLLASVDGIDIESRTAARARAQARQVQAAEREAAAQQAVADRNADLKHIRKPRVHRQLPEQPTEITRAGELVRLAAIAVTELEAHEENLTRDRNNLQKQLSGLSGSLAGFEALSTAMNASVPAGAVPPGEPYDQVLAEAQRTHRGLMADVGEHAAKVKDAAARVSQAADKVAECVTSSHYEKLATSVKEQIARTARVELPKHAATWLGDLAPRLRTVDDDLNQVERHRGSLVIRLQGLVDQALRTLTRAQRMSKLPASLGDWSGEEFLRIKFTFLEGEALRQRLGEVIDEAAMGKDAAGKPVLRDGLSILFRGVAAAVPQGFRVDMLKPDSVLRNERVPIAGVHDVFSGGQQLTAAIVLYCTMAALRANERGRVANPHSGVLFLDNPIGTASAGYLLDIQGGVAAALGVQLIYTTGLFDAEVLAGFPVLVRLRNDADIRANRRYLKVEQSVNTHWESLAEPDETARIAATRMIVRQRRELNGTPRE